MEWPLDCLYVYAFIFRPVDLEENKAKRIKQDERAQNKKKSVLQIGNVLSSNSAMAGLRYRPKTKDTQRVYELLLSFITGCLGSQPQDILCGAADEVLDILKEDKLKVRPQTEFARPVHPLMLV